jgi:ribonuclease HI
LCANKTKIPQEMRNNIKNIESPKSIKQLRRILGLINFISKFVPFANKELALLNAPLKNNAKRLNWSPDLETALKNIKNKIGSYDEICPKKYDKDMFLVCDASDHGIGSVLLQSRKNNFDPKNITWDDFKLINCHSKLLTPAERNYTTTEKEILAIIKSLKTIKTTILSGRENLHVLTDHKNLKGINCFEIKRHRHMRWLKELGDCKLKIHFIQGQKNYIVDCPLQVEIKQSSLQ